MPKADIVIYNVNGEYDVIHAVVYKKDFPIKINFQGKVYDLIMTKSGKLRLGIECSEHRKLKIPIDNKS